MLEAKNKSVKRKKKKRNSLIRVAGMTVLFLLLILGIAFVASDLDSAQNPVAETLASEGYFYAVSSDNVRAMNPFFNDGLVILTDTAVKYFDSYGNLIGSNECTFSNPVLKTAGKNALLFDRGAYALRVEKKGSKFLSLTFDSVITTGAVGKNGTYAYVLNSDGGFQSHLYVFDSKGSKRFEWGCSSDYITDVAVSNNGRYVCAAVMGADNAEYFSKVILFGLNREEPVYEIKLPGVAVYSVIFASSKKVIAYTDSGVYSFHSDGEYELLQKYSSSEMKLSSLSVKSLGATVINQYGNEKNVLLTVFSKDHKVFFEKEYSDPAKFLSTSAGYAAIAFADRIEVLNSEGSLIGKIPLDENCSACTVSGRKIYVLIPSGIKSYSALSLS